MLDFESALSALKERFKSLSIQSTQTLALRNSLGRIIAEDLVSSISVPPADNSAMDGYAINSKSIHKTPHSLAITQRIIAGTCPKALQAGTAARIFTGGEIPEGADCVVMQENCEQNASTVTINKEVNKGGNIRRKGQDINKGDKLFSVGHRIQAQDIGLLASIGLTEIQVYKKLRISILSTGNELIRPGLPLDRGQIYDSNRPMIEAMCRELDTELVESRHIPDDLKETVKVLEELGKKSDLIISCGGVSVGEEDHIKNAVLEIGNLDFWKIKIKPGKPIAVGTLDNSCGFLGLPGNPVSAFVTFHLFGKLIINVLQGQHQYEMPRYLEKANFATKGKNSRPEFARAKLSEFGLDLYPNQSSGVLSSVCWADALALIPENQAISIGDLVEVFPI